MNEQEQQVIDILTDQSLYKYVGEFEDIQPDDEVIAEVAHEITKIFQPTQKDTRSRREKILDAEFERIGVKPRIYHFTKDISSFKCVTIADINVVSKISARLMVDAAMRSIYYREHEKATHFLAYLNTINSNGVYGVAICDKSSTINKRYGRNKAKGKLWQHLLKEAQKK